KKSYMVKGDMEEKNIHDTKEMEEEYQKNKMEGETKSEYINRVLKAFRENHNSKMLKAAKGNIDKAYMSKGCVKKEYTVRKDGMEKSYLGQEGDPHGSRSMLKENILNKPYRVNKTPSTLSETLDDMKMAYMENGMPGESIDDYARRYLRETSGRQVNEMHERLQKDCMEKAFVKATSYTNKQGKTVQRKAYVDKRQKKVTHVKHSKMTRLDIAEPDAKKKIEELNKKKKHHDLNIEAATSEKEKAEAHKKAGNSTYKVGNKEHDVNAVIKHLDDHIEHHTNENKSHDNHIKKIEGRHETEAKHFEKKREKKKVVSKEKPTGTPLTFKSQPEYMDWYRKQPQDIKDSHKLNREGGKLVVSLSGKEEVKKPVEKKPLPKNAVVVKKETKGGPSEKDIKFYTRRLEKVKDQWGGDNKSGSVGAQERGPSMIKYAQAQLDAVKAGKSPFEVKTEEEKV
ncbi:unnamed protein product, partial [marine sediment metagenome]